MKKNKPLITRFTVIGALLSGILLFLITGFPCFADVNTFTETFDTGIEENGWNLNVFVGNPSADYTSINSKRIEFDLQLKNTYLALTNEQTITDNSSVEAVFENILSNDAAYGVICRSSDQGWYELRINVAGPLAGSYSVLKYDADRKGKYRNVYVEIHPGMTHFFTGDIKLGLKVKNKIRLDCNGDTFKVTINDRPQTQYHRGVFTDSQFTEGAAGVTVQAYQSGSVKIDLVEFNVKGDNLPLYGQSSGDLQVDSVPQISKNTPAPVSSEPDISNLNQTIAALEAMLGAQAATPEIPLTEAPGPTKAPMMEASLTKAEKKTEINKAGLYLTLIALFPLGEMLADTSEIPAMELPVPTEIPTIEPTATEPAVLIDSEIEVLNQTMTALEILMEKQEPTPEA